MVDPNNPIIDTRDKVVDDGSSATHTTTPATSTDGGNTSTPASATTQGGSSSTTTTQTTTSSVPISSKVPEQFTASSYAELIPQLEKKMAEYKPLSEEELKKLRRKQKAEGIISGISDAVQSVANLVATSQYAPNMYNPKEGMSVKAKERFEKEKAQREADADKFLNYALTIGKMKDADTERGLQAWQTEQSLARTDRAYDAGRKDREDDVAFRNKDYDERVREWQENFDRQGEWHKEEGERWEKQFKESIREFNVNSSFQRQSLALQAKRLAHEMQQGQMTFNLGSGGNVTLSVDKLNAQTIARIYSTLPKEVRDKVKGEPIVSGAFVSYKDTPTTEAMLIAIGENVASSPATQDAIRQVAGIKKPKAY